LLFVQVYQFPLDLQKTGQIIRNSLTTMGDVLGVKEMSKHFYFVTDQGSNIQSALGYGFNRLACACHCLATALRHALPDGPGDQGQTEELQNLKLNITAVKSLVQYFKKSGQNALLERTLLQENDTRWNTLLMIIESVINQEDDIRRVLHEKGEDHRVNGIDFGMLKDIAKFLSPFKQATKSLEANSYPTIHRVYLWYQKLQRHVETQCFDSSLIAQLKERLTVSLQEKFQMSKIHKLALFLNPQYKMLRKLDSVDRMDVHSLARHLIHVLSSMDDEVKEDNTGPSTSTATFVYNSYTSYR
jgi:hypothetical protein